MSEEKKDAVNAEGTNPASAVAIREVEYLDLDDKTPAGFNTEFLAEVPWGGKPVAIRFTTEGWEEAGLEFKRNNNQPEPPYTWEVTDDPASLAKLKQDKPCAVKAVDVQDTAFQELYKKWSDDYNRYVLAKCMLTKPRINGEVLTDATKIAAALKDKGMSGQMAGDLSTMVVARSKARESKLTAFTGGA